MNTTVQTKIEEVYSDSKNFPEDMNGELIQSSMVVLNPHTGEIVGLMEDVTILLTRFKQSNTNETFSRIHYQAYICLCPSTRKRICPAAVVDDVPVSFGNYKPTNYDGRYRGLINLKKQLRFSQYSSCKMLNTIGVNTGFEYAKKWAYPL